MARYRDNIDDASFIIVVLFVLIGFIGIGGWIANLIKLIYASNDPVTVLIGLRVVGIFVAPLGAILGLFV